MEKSCTPTIIPKEVTAKWEKLRARVMATEEAGRVKLRKEDVSELIVQHSTVAKNLEVSLREAGALNDWYLRYVDRMNELTDAQRAPSILAEDPLRFPESEYFKKEFLQAPVIATRAHYDWVLVDRFERAMSSIEKLWRARGVDERTMLYSALMDMQEERDAKAQRLAELADHHEEFDELLREERALHTMEREHDRLQIQTLKTDRAAQKIENRALAILNEFAEGRAGFWHKASQGVLTEEALAGVDVQQRQASKIQEQQRAIADYTRELTECRALNSDLRNERRSLVKNLTNATSDLQRGKETLDVARATCKTQSAELEQLERTQSGYISALENQVALLTLSTSAPATTTIGSQEVETLRAAVTENTRRWKVNQVTSDQRTDFLQKDHHELEQRAAKEKLEHEELQKQWRKSVEAVSSMRRKDNQARTFVLSKVDEIGQNMTNVETTMRATFQQETLMRDIESNLKRIKELTATENSAKREIAMLIEQVKHLRDETDLKEAIEDRNIKLQSDVVSLQVRLTAANNNLDRYRLIPDIAAGVQAVQDFEQMKAVLGGLIDDLTKTFSADILSAPMELVGAPVQSSEIQEFETKLGKVAQRAKEFVAAVAGHVTRVKKTLGLPDPQPGDLLMTGLSQVEKELVKVRPLVDDIKASLLKRGASISLVKTLTAIGAELENVTKAIGKLEEKTGEPASDQSAILTRLTNLKVGKTAGVSTALLELEEASGVPAAKGAVKDTKTRLAAVTRVVTKRRHALEEAKKTLDEMLEQLEKGVGGEITVSQVNALSDVVFGVGKEERGVPIDQMHALLNALQPVSLSLVAVLVNAPAGLSLKMYTDELISRFLDLKKAQGLIDDVAQKLLMAMDFGFDPTNMPPLAKVEKSARVTNRMLQFFVQTTGSVLADEYQWSIAQREGPQKGKPQLLELIPILLGELQQLTNAYRTYMALPVFDKLEDSLKAAGRKVPWMKERLEQTTDIFREYEDLVFFIETTLGIEPTKIKLREVNFEFRSQTTRASIKQIRDNLSEVQLTALQNQWTRVYDSQEGKKRTIRDVTERDPVEGFGEPTMKKQRARGILPRSNDDLLSAFTEFCSTLFDAQ